MQVIEPLQDLSNLSPSYKPGFDKKWPLKDKLQVELNHDYLQKINFSIQDFNSTIEDGFDCHRKDVIFLIVLVDWIESAIDLIPSCYRAGILDSFQFVKQEQLDRHNRFLKAVRSFVLAHPLKTDRHKGYGLNGDYICIDIHKKSRVFSLGNQNMKKLTPEGLVDVGELGKDDVILAIYSKSDGAEFFQHIGFDMADVRDSAALNINKLYALDRYLSNLKERDFRIQKSSTRNTATNT